MGFVRIDRRYWETVLREYSHWPTAWVREAGQNSLDAGAHRIEVEVHEDREGVTMIEWADDGCGMTREVLENKFLALGATGKDFQGGMVGGMGVAKSLLCFAQQSYAVRTNKLYLTGEADEFQIKSLPKIASRRGVVLAAKLKYPGCDMGDTVKSWARKTWTKGAKIYLNGAELETGPSIEGLTPSAENSYGKLFVLDSAPPGIVDVRINGQWMFETQVEGSRGGIYELTSPESLNTNRESLKYDVRTAFEVMLNDVFSDKSKIQVSKQAKITILAAKGWLTTAGLLEGKGRGGMTVQGLLERGDTFAHVMIFNATNLPDPVIGDWERLVLAEWQTAIEWVMRHCPSLAKLGVGIGLCYKAGAMAMTAFAEGGIFLCISPKLIERRAVLAEIKDKNWKPNELREVAIHELVHAFTRTNYHGDDYTTYYGQLVTELLDNLKV